MHRSGVDLLLGKGFEIEPLATITSRFCSIFSIALSSEIGSEFKCSLESFKFRKASSIELEPSCLSKTFNLGPSEAAGIIKVGPKLVYHLLEHLLGNDQPSEYVPNRPFTLFERSVGGIIIKLALKGLFHSISLSCENLNLSVEQSMAHGSDLPANLTVAQLNFLLSCQEYSELINIALPYCGKSAQSFGGALAASDLQGWRHNLTKSIMNTEFTVEARMFDTKTRDLSDLINLEVGSSIMFGNRANERVNLILCPSALLARGRLGDSNGNLGISISSTVE